MSTIVATAMQFPREKGVRMPLIEIHPNDSTKAVRSLYYKSALTVHDLGTKTQQRKGSKGRRNQRIVVVDVFYGCVLWGFESKDGYSAAKTRFSRMVKKGKKEGFYVKGRFIQLN